MGITENASGGNRTKKKNVFIKTYGCQMNEHDSEKILELLKKEGYRLTKEEEKADLLLLNTCSIREKPEHKVYSLLGRYGQLKKKNPRLILGVGGCVAQQYGKKLF